ncbi:MAG: 4-hydroxy-3-methylbut-2-enyl diphosphate reductase [Alphaproteobacteria bacterium]|jgi:4-hydroxy-3-methylbut-2-en-1-yl diphosphate reductase|nr:4-hydroxy-3-methylbut-2-enyl diphosphate reductase [Alphaproteobacteria bacterium]MBT5827554.1 4-hydroxy-3-methylbut-2-enyl diphosphate reductase [Alphaproteobacteria bacterium]
MQENLERKKTLNIFLANPRGFCAGVERAISIVEKALEKYGAPIYIKHEIVHNKYVVDTLKEKGAIFVEDVAEIPQNAITIYSAHGVSKKVELDSEAKASKIFDATCPLVKKVHNRVVNLAKDNKKIILIGHNNHPEVEGTSGRVAEEVILIENKDDALRLELDDCNNLAYTTQTTLSIDDTREIIAILKKKFPNIIEPKSDDICYATQNRQNAVKAIVKDIDLLLVIGAKNSSNSNRLRDIGTENNKKSFLIADAAEINDKWLENISNIAITAGASAPEILVEEVINYLKENFLVNIKHIDGKKENIVFNLPKELQ